MSSSPSPAARALSPLWRKPLVAVNHSNGIDQNIHVLMAMESVGDDGVDRISALPDDLLHHILAGVGDAAAVMRTSVLSRRWRGLWIRAPDLVLEDTAVVPSTDNPTHFADFVDWVLAERGADDVGSLSIDMSSVSPRACATHDRINPWLRYAMQRVVNSFGFYPPFCGTVLTDDKGERVSNDEPEPIVMPDVGRMRSLELDLRHCSRLHLPMAATARYEALTELDLMSISFDEDQQAGGGGRTLGDFVSSCCPRLRRLCIWNSEGLPRLVLRTEALQELTLALTQDLQTLDVTAPNLRVLKMSYCFYDVGSVRVSSAKRLEEVGVHEAQGGVALDMQDNLTSVRRLDIIDLFMHGRRYGPDTAKGLWLLENCPAVEHARVALKHWRACNHDNVPLPLTYLKKINNAGFIQQELADLIRSETETAPLPVHKFATVTSMEIMVYGVAFPEGHLAASMSSLLLRLPHLRSLCIKFRHPISTSSKDFSSQRWRCVCSRYDTIAPQEFSLGYLEKVKISGFVGADDELQVVELLFASSNSMKSMTLNAIEDSTSETGSLKQMMTEEELMNIPGTNRGSWHFGKDEYTWAIGSATPISDEGTSSSST